VGTLEKVMDVILALRETAKTFPNEQFSVSAPAEIVGAVFVSLNPVYVPVVIVGDVLNTKEPEPVSSVTAEARLALEGVAKNVATPLPKPDTPVDIGRPVQDVNVPEEGVPSAGVTNVGDVDKTTLPDPVEVVTPVPPLATGRVPDTCVVSPIFPQEGATPTPPEINELPVATSASLESAEVVEA
jgi:hypothetical protein